MGFSLRIAEEMKEFNCTEFTIAYSKKWVREKLLNSKNKTRNRDGIMDIVTLRKQLEIDEGIKHEIYLDHLGLPTFGICYLIIEGDPEYAWK